MTETLTGTPARNYVGGEWRDAHSGETYEQRNPWRPSQVTGVYPSSGADDVAAAVEAAPPSSIAPRTRSTRGRSGSRST
jgi:acyl-CoA reductase-like NAD-dependent aldehyde dehydrogenase